MVGWKQWAVPGPDHITPLGDFGPRRSPYLGLGITLLCFLGWLRIAIGMREGRPIMAKLIYSVITSLDGYVADKEGNFDWAAPNAEVHTFVNRSGYKAPYRELQDFRRGEWHPASRIG